MSPSDTVITCLLPRRLQARVEEAWRQLGLKTMRERGVNTATRAWVEDYALEAWSSQCPDVEDETARRVEAFLALLRPETDRADRAYALQVITEPMPPVLFQERVVAHVLAHLWQVSDPWAEASTLEFGWDEDDAAQQAATRLGWWRDGLQVRKVEGT